MKADLQSLVQGKKNDTEDTKKGAINSNKRTTRGDKRWRESTLPATRERLIREIKGNHICPLSMFRYY